MQKFYAVNSSLSVVDSTGDKSIVTQQFPDEEMHVLYNCVEVLKCIIKSEGI